MNVSIAACIREQREERRTNVVYDALGWQLRCLAAPTRRVGKPFLVFVVEDLYLNYFVEYIDSLDFFDAILTFKRENAQSSSGGSGFAVIDFQLQQECVFFVTQNLMVPVEHWAAQPNCVLLLTEQLTEAKFLRHAQDFVNRGGLVVTYSQHNKSLLASDSCYCLLYEFNQKEVDTLRTFVPPTPEYDVAMVPCRFQRRRAISNLLQRAGLSVIEIDDEWGENRDRAIANSRVLLNVHVKEDYTVYEHFRCDRWLFVGSPTVVSEHCVNQSALDCADLIQWADYANIVERCCDIVAAAAGKSARGETSTLNAKRGGEIAQARHTFNQKELELLLQKLDRRARQTKPGLFLAQYGTNAFQIDVTEIVRREFCDSNRWLRIAPDVNFNFLFGDVAKNMPKRLLLDRISLPERREVPFESGCFMQLPDKIKIPIFIISHNRLTMLLRCIKAIQQCFDADTYEIVVHDNVSTYQPLITFLEGSSLRVYWNKRNELDDVALSVERYFAETGNTAPYYAVTDPDVEFEVGITPADAMQFYTHLLDTHSNVNAVGPELRVDDIPDHYPLKQDLLQKHALGHADDKFFQVGWRGLWVVKCAFRPLDTTFGVYRRGFKFHRLNDAILCHGLFSARHLDWYIDPNNMAPDDLLYMQQTTRWGHWSSEYLRPHVNK
jgi:hypothetical protein